MHLEYIFPAILAFGAFIFCAWLAFFPSKALDMYVNVKMMHLTVFPPKKIVFTFGKP